MATETTTSWRAHRGLAIGLVVIAAAMVAAVTAWQSVMSIPDPTARASTTAAVIDVGILVFREGLECVLVLTAVTASMVGATRAYRRPVAAGAAVAFVATLLTWRGAVTVIDDLGRNVPALDLQALTGLLAILVLVVIMNWFFHKVYWTGWISLHTNRKRRLLEEAEAPLASRRRLLWGLALLGFTSLYREGFEVVLFLQSYRLKLGNGPILGGVLVGLALTVLVGVLAFVGQRHLPYKRMLVVTGVMLGFVLVVMVGEQAQEMQLAHWLSVTRIGWLDTVIPAWAGLWFSVFPTVETLGAQVAAVALVLGSYVLAGVRSRRHRRVRGAGGGELVRRGAAHPARTLR